MSDQYKKAGVDLEAADEAVRRIAPAVSSTRIPGVVGGIGGFGGLFDPIAAGVGADALLVAGADGVGTKLKLAFATGVHHTVGIDCVAMCVNDILTLGARPLFFLDYLAVGELDPGVVATLVEGVARGCRQAGCALLGGETAEMPGMYRQGEYDLAGFAVGAVHPERIVDGRRVSAGDVLIGLPSSGFHSNGFSLLRRVLLEQANLPLDRAPDGFDRPLYELLLEPTRIYVRDVLALLDARVPVHAMVHVTGGGLPGNLPRVLPEGLAAVLDPGALAAMEPPGFELVARLGEVDRAEMARVFNMGVGYVLVVPARAVDEVLRRGPDGSRVIGEVRPRRDAPVVMS